MPEGTYAILPDATSYYMLVPTNTTSTAAYVAVVTSVSALVALIPRDMSAANMVTAKDTVTKLFVLVGVGRLMTSMGTTRLWHKWCPLHKQPAKLAFAS